MHHPIYVTQAFHQGRLACFRFMTSGSLSPPCNPFPRRTFEHFDWLDGFAAEREMLNQVEGDDA